MKGDFTRNTFVPSKAFSRVMMQQGRVQLDADWNEQVAIFWHYMRSLVADLIGPHGGPEHNLGFTITPKGTLDFVLWPGHYYVQGVLCDNRMPLRYSAQRDYPLPAAEQLEPNANYLVFLDVWERHITYVEDDHIREVALGGPDTATRAQVVFQVKTLPLSPAEMPGAGAGGSGEASAEFTDLKRKLEALLKALEEAKEAGDEAKAEELGEAVKKIRAQMTEFEGVGVGGGGLSCEALLENKLHELGKLRDGHLRARAYVEPTPDEPCITPPEAQYRGPENQLYRVEIHSSGGDKKATFKWSRENGSVVLPIRSVKTDSESDTTTLELEHLGRNERFSLQAGDWVELVDDAYVLQSGAEPMQKVVHVDRTEFQVVLEGTPNSNVGQDEAKHPLLRRWDQKADEEADLTMGLRVVEGKWLDLEDGVQVFFGSRETSHGPAMAEEVIKVEQEALYETGDYWIIPARTATGDVEWPQREDIEGREQPAPMPPLGVKHYYAPLGLITVQENEKVSESYIDCRRKFQALGGPVAVG